MAGIRVDLANVHTDPHVVVHIPPPGLVRLTPADAWALAEQIARAATLLGEYPVRWSPLSVALDEPAEVASWPR